VSLRVSVIIPNWNGARHLPTCLDSLRAQTHPEVEVIVVDNASEDGSQALVAEGYPEVMLILLSENRGFTGACNAGLQTAGGDILILLNNDTEVAPTWAAEVAAAFERHPEAGMVASKMLLFDQRDVFHTAGDFYRVDGIPGRRPFSACAAARRRIAGRCWGRLACWTTISFSRRRISIWRGGRSSAGGGASTRRGRSCIIVWRRRAAT
jgi:GT2 family glycosyltransferase